MNILVILGHPNPGSFNHAIAHTVCETLEKNDHAVIFHDLYREGFDPLLPAEEIPEKGPMPNAIQKHCEELATADGIVIVHPNWWGQPPAILKGWIDRIIRPGVAYRFEEDDGGEGIPIGLLKAGQALILNTSNTPTVREQQVFGDPLEMLWKMCIFDLCGIRNVRRRMFNVICTSTMRQREEWLTEAAGLTAALFPKPTEMKQ